MPRCLSRTTHSSKCQTRMHRSPSCSCDVPSKMGCFFVIPIAGSSGSGDSSCIQLSLSSLPSFMLNHWACPASNLTSIDTLIPASPSPKKPSLCCGCECPAGSWLLGAQKTGAQLRLTNNCILSMNQRLAKSCIMPREALNRYQAADFWLENDFWLPNLCVALLQALESSTSLQLHHLRLFYGSWGVSPRYPRM